MTLERCRSGFRTDSPAPFEPVITGTAAEIAEHYGELTHMQRVNDGWRVRDGDEAMTMEEFFFQAVS